MIRIALINGYSSRHNSAAYNRAFGLGLLRDAFHLAVGGVPRNIDLAQVRQFLVELPGMEAVHDLHIWGLSTAEVALTAHLVKPDSEGNDALIARAQEILQSRFDIDYVTLQWERQKLIHCGDESCD